MAKASLQASPAGRLPASDTFSKALFSQEVTGWLQRASAADKERFEQAFSSIKWVDLKAWAVYESTCSARQRK